MVLAFLRSEAYFSLRRGSVGLPLLWSHSSKISPYQIYFFIFGNMPIAVLEWKSPPFQKSLIMFLHSVRWARTRSSSWPQSATISLFPGAASNACLILYLSLSRAGWFCRLGLRDEILPVSVLRLREQWILESESTQSMSGQMNVFRRVLICLQVINFQRLMHRVLPNYYFQVPLNLLKASPNLPSLGLPASSEIDSASTEGIPLTVSFLTGRPRPLILMGRVAGPPDYFRLRLGMTNQATQGNYQTVFRTTYLVISYQNQKFSTGASSFSWALGSGFFRLKGAWRSCCSCAIEFRLKCQIVSSWKVFRNYLNYFSNCIKSSDALFLIDERCSMFILIPVFSRSVITCPKGRHCFTYSSYMSGIDFHTDDFWIFRNSDQKGTCQSVSKKISRLGVERSVADPITDILGSGVECKRGGDDRGFSQFSVFQNLFFREKSIQGGLVEGIASLLVLEDIIQDLGRVFVLFLELHQIGLPVLLHLLLIQLRQLGQRVLSRQQGGVEESSHVHGVSPKASEGDSVVLDDVPIEAVVVEYLEVFL